MTVDKLLLIASILGTGLVTGIFFAFSTFIMRALARLDPKEGIRAMQAINTTVLNPWFFSAFFGTGVVLLFHALMPALRSSEQYSIATVFAALLYNVGTIGVTIVRNVPLNNRLDKVDSESSEAREFWRHYLKRWLFWNHVRTIAAAAACVWLIVATSV